MTALLAGPAWLVLAVIALIVVVLYGPERTYRRALGLIHAFRDTSLGPPGHGSDSGVIPPESAPAPGPGQEGS